MPNVIILAFLSCLILAILLLIVWLLKLRSLKAGTKSDQPVEPVEAAHSRFLKKRGMLAARIPTEKKSNLSDWSDLAEFEDAVNDITTEKERGGLLEEQLYLRKKRLQDEKKRGSLSTRIVAGLITVFFVLTAPLGLGNLVGPFTNRRSYITAKLPASELSQTIITALTSPAANAVTTAITYTTSFVALVKALRLVMEQWKKEPRHNGGPPPGPPPPTTVIIGVSLRTTEEDGRSSYVEAIHPDLDQLNQFINRFGQSPSSIKSAEATFKRADSKELTLKAPIPQDGVDMSPEDTSEVLEQMLIDARNKKKSSLISRRS